jgi:hypothetical protein
LDSEPWHLRAQIRFAHRAPERGGILLSNGFLGLQIPTRASVEELVCATENSSLTRRELEFGVVDKCLHHDCVVKLGPFGRIVVGSDPCVKFLQVP